MVALAHTSHIDTSLRLDEPRKGVVLTTPRTLSSLRGTQKKVGQDFRRTGALILLNKSMGTWTESKSPAWTGHEQDSPKARSSRIMARSATMAAARKSTVTGNRYVVPEHSSSALEIAFDTHCAAFGLDGDGTISVEELILVFERSMLFDELFTPSKLRNYFSTLVDGCNHIEGIRNTDVHLRGIGFNNFRRALDWAADIKGTDEPAIARKVINLSKKLCDKCSSIQRRLEVVFEGFCKQRPDRMSTYEFGNLCRIVEVPFCMGDIISFFTHLPTGYDEDGADFAAFITAIKHIGLQLGYGDDVVFLKFARAVEYMSTDQSTIIRIKMRIRHAFAVVVGGAMDFTSLFEEYAHNEDGDITYEEFLLFCRQKLHLVECDSALHVLYEKIDSDGSGGVSVEEFVEFIQDG